jgi:hypothetical protein
MPTNNPERDREDLLKTFASVFGTAEGEKIIDALVVTAYQITDPGVRVGFEDAIMFILRNRTRGKEMQKPPSVRGTARLGLKNTGPGVLNQGTESEE